MEKIGFIGMGIMGRRMAAHLQRAGYPLIVYNRSKAKADDLIQAGAEWADSPAVVGAAADVLFTMLSEPAVVMEVAIGEGGFLQEMTPGNIWVDCSTVAPSFSELMYSTAAELGVKFMDAPVAGSMIPAEQGTLVFLAGGDAADLERITPYLELMGSRTIHAGAHGDGAALKMVVNQIMADGMRAFAEGMALGCAWGLDESRLMDALISLPVTMPLIASKKAKILERDFEPHFPLKWLHKDLYLAGTMAYESGVSMPGAASTRELYALARRSGLGDMDMSAIYPLLNPGQYDGDDPDRDEE